MAPTGTHLDTYPVPGGIFSAAYVTPPDESIVITGGDGCYVTTETGEEYLDYKLGSGPLLLGHAHPAIIDAVTRQAEKGTTYYLPNRPGLELAKRIVSAVPCADQLKFTSTGTEATYLSLRIARAYTGNAKVLKFEGGYHGWHDQALISSNRASEDTLDATEFPHGTTDTAGVDPGTAANTLAVPFNDTAKLEEVMDEHGDELAAVITEPLMRSISPEPGFLETLRAVCDEHDVVLIFDEVVTGFRLAWGGAQEYYGVQPDLATYGKSIGGGTPIAAVCGREEYMELTDPSLPNPDQAVVSGTLSGNPMSAAAGLAALDVLEQPGTYNELHEYASDLRAVFTDVLADSSLPGVGLGEGPVVDYAITDQSAVTNFREYLQTDAATKKAIDRELFEQNIIKSIGGKCYVSTQHGTDELDRTEEAFKHAVSTVENSQ